MSLRDEWERSGETLFRWRSYPPLALILLVLAAAFVPARIPLHNRTGHEAWEGLCLLVGLLGVAIRAHVVGHAPQGTSGRNVHAQVAETVNQTGMYSVVRHPLYVGNFLMWLGPMLVLRSPWAALVMVLGFWLYYERIMFAEEEFLRRTFGEGWSAWAARTPAFVPRLTGWRAPALPLSVRNVLKREYSGLFGMALGFGFADWVDDYVTYGSRHPDAASVAVMVAGAVIYLALRTLKKRSHVLEVAGR